MKLVLYMIQINALANDFSKNLHSVHLSSKGRLCSKLSNISRKAHEASENDIFLRSTLSIKGIYVVQTNLGQYLYHVYIFLLVLHKPSENNICSKIGAQSSARRQFGANLGGEGQKLPSGAKLPSWGRRSL